MVSTNVNIGGARCLVTGGAGLVGSHIVDELLARGASHVRVVDNLTRGRVVNLARHRHDDRLELVVADLRDRDLVHDAMGGIDLCFHQAAIRITQCAEDPRLAVEVLVDATYNVIEAARDRNVSKVVAASSASVYGLAEEFPTSEAHHPWANRTLYGAAKVFNEGMLRAFHDQHGLDYVALRYFNVYGPRMDIHGVYTEVLVRWMERIESGLPPMVFGDGSQTLDLVYITDIAAANIAAATAPVTDRVFNVASGTETSLAQLARTLAEVMGADACVEHAAERKVNPVPRRLADVRAAHDELGFTARVDLEDGLTRLVEWWRSEQAAAITADHEAVA